MPHEETRRAGTPEGGAWRWLGVAAAGVVLAALLLRWVAGERLTPGAVLALVDSVRGEPWALPAFLLAYVLLTSALVPAALLHLVAGAAWGVPLGLALSTGACNVVACVQFCVARRLGRAPVARLLARYRLGALDAGAGRDGVRATLLLRFMPLPFLVANTAGGVSALRLRHFALGTFLATLPLNVAQVYFGASFARGLEGEGPRALGHVAVAGLLLVLASYAPRLWRRRAARRRDSGA
jgi:uncharacterized membrane protein YdjX (TVP38/TMEM64 family)